MFLLSYIIKQPFQTHKLETELSEVATVKRDDALHYYKQMQTIRRMEVTADNLYKSKQIRGFCHLYNGQVCIANFYEGFT